MYVIETRRHTYKDIYLHMHVPGTCLAVHGNDMTHPFIFFLKIDGLLAGPSSDNGVKN